MAKRALCIGINNYPGTNMDLQGCVNDADDWAAVLDQCGFSVTQLLDSKATKSRMVREMKKLIASGRRGDNLVITYSGHGTCAPDSSGDEPDGLDEALCPYDIGDQRVLVDDEIATLFSARREGARLLLIADSCHSGTLTRAAPSGSEVEGSTRIRFMPMGNWLRADRLPRNARGVVASRLAVDPAASAFQRALRGGDDLLLAGCQEGPNHFSYDARMGGRFNGAFTYYALKTLRELTAKGRRVTYAAWHKAIRSHLPSASYPQSPQLFGGTAARRLPVFT